MKIAASFLTSKNKAKDLSKLNVTTIDYIHVDYMDGKFVKQKTLPFRELKKIYKYTSKRLDVHLMCNKPIKLIRKFASLNTEYISVHVELQEDLKKILHYIHKYGIKAGLAINPDTDIEILKDYLDDIDLILVMSVNPGLGGQTFIESTTEKISNISKMIHSEGKSNILISVDGGINAETKDKVSDVDILVSGSFITNSYNFQESIDILRGLVDVKYNNSLEAKESLENINNVEYDENKKEEILKTMTVEDLMKAPVEVKELENNDKEIDQEVKEEQEEEKQNNSEDLTYEQLLENMSKTGLEE